MCALRLLCPRLPRSHLIVTPAALKAPAAPICVARSFHQAANSISPNMASSPFSRTVFESMRTLYPECLADKSFDNTGLLLEAPILSTRRNKNSVLLTIDLTSAVAKEAIEEGHSVVVAYHPIIFRGLKSITLQDSQQQSLLQLAAHGVSVYSPHTAVDIVPNGMADWLGDMVTGTGTSSHGEKLAHTRSVITASPASDIDLANRLAEQTVYESSNTGAGRLISFTSPVRMSELIARLGGETGHPEWFSVAVPQGTRSMDDLQIKTVGVCPGSGASVMRACRPAPDLIVTGEMSHHDALAVTERGGSVVTLFHSNSERGYLSAVMRPRLEHLLQQNWERNRRKWLQETEPDTRETLCDDDSVLVKVSCKDKDPFTRLVPRDKSRAA